MSVTTAPLNVFAAQRARRSRRYKIALRISATAIPIVFVLLWQWYGSRPDSFAIAPFTEVLSAFIQGFLSGQYTAALVGTLGTVAVGFIVAATLGVAIGLWIGISAFARNVVEPLTNALYATPVSLLIPVIAIYTGLDWRGRVFLVVLWSIFEIIVTTSTGVRSVHNTLIEVGQVFGASRQFINWRLIVPAATPHIVVGLRLGVARSMRGAVTAELMLAAANVGLIILTAGARFDIPNLLAGIILTMILGVLLMSAASLIERRLLAYLKPSDG